MKIKETRFLSKLPIAGILAGSVIFLGFGTLFYGWRAGVAGTMSFGCLGAIGSILIFNGARSSLDANETESRMIMLRAHDLGKRRNRFEIGERRRSERPGFVSLVRMPEHAMPAPAFRRVRNRI